MNSFYLYGLAFVMSVLPLAAQSLSYIDLARRLLDLEQLAVLPQPGEKCGQWSSFDRASRFDGTTNRYMHWDANADGEGFIRAEEENLVLAEMEGPGCIWRIWSARPEQGHVKIYLDGLAEPAVDLPFAGYFDGSAEPFIYPALVHTTARGQNCYLPIPYQKSCKIVAEKGWGRYFQFTYSNFPKNYSVPTFKRKLSAAEKRELERIDNFLRHEAGSRPERAHKGEKTFEADSTWLPATEKTIFNRSGSGAIAALQIRVDLPVSISLRREVLRHLILKMYWDGDEKPAVCAPLGDFFGTAPGANFYQSLPMGLNQNGFYSYWYMPFTHGARISISNENPNSCRIYASVSVAPLKRAASCYARFHAKWHRDFLLPQEPERAVDWTLLKTSGAGRYCGVMLHVWNPRGDWWGEGDEKFFVDDETFPSTFGTGSEDYFGYAWCDPQLFSHAFHNQTLSMENKGHISVNRWHVADNIPFQSAFAGYIEKYYANERPTLYAATVYWYLNSAGDDPYPDDSTVSRSDYWITPPVDALKDVLEGEGLQIGSLTGGRAQAQSMNGKWPQFWSSQAHLYWTDGQMGDHLDLMVPVQKAGHYSLFAQFTKSPASAVIQLAMDGVNVGNRLDLYSPVPPAASIPAGEMGSYEFDQSYGLSIRKHEKPSGPLYLGALNLSQGEHVLRISLVDKHASSSGKNRVGLDYIRLVFQD